MKAMMKKLGITLIAGVLACLCLVGCGAISMDDIKGDWTADTMDGKSLADYAASIGLTEGQVVTNWTIKDDKTMTCTNITGVLEFDMELKSNGFELKQKGKDEIFCSVLFDKDAGTLTYDTKDANGSTIKCVMKKGTGTIEAASEGSGEAEEATEEGSEEEATEDESADDGSAEDESSDEGEEEVEEEEAE